jgi:hypothetical protein
MWNPKVLSTLEELSSQRYLLSQRIRAIELGPDQMGKMRLGPVSTIPAGSEVECCGQGFNANTVRVRCRGRFYFVYRQDLEMQHEAKARCACCGE